MAQVSLLDLFVKHNYRWSYMMIRSSVLVERWTLTPHKCPRRSLFSHPLTPMLWPLTPAWVHCEYAMWLRLKKKKKEHTLTLELALFSLTNWWWVRSSYPNSRSMNTGASVGHQQDSQLFVWCSQQANRCHCCRRLGLIGVFRLLCNANKMTDVRWLWKKGLQRTGRNH